MQYLPDENTGWCKKTRLNNGNGQFKAITHNVVNRSKVTFRNYIPELF